MFRSFHVFLLFLLPNNTLRVHAGGRASKAGLGSTSMGASAWSFHPPGQQISGRAGKGGIYGSTVVDPGPPCCQICTKKIYHSLALMELSEHDERTALVRFHHYRDGFRAAKRRNMEQQKQQLRPPKKQRRTTTSLLETSSESTRSQGFMDSISSGMGAMGAGMANSGGGSTENSYGGVDVMERISYIVDDAQQAGPHEMKSTPPTFKVPDKMEGSMGGGPCCNVCPLWFIPQNQKLHLQGDIAPEFGPAVGVFLEQQNSRGSTVAHQATTSAKASGTQQNTVHENTVHEHSNQLKDQGGQRNKKGFVGGVASAMGNVASGGAGPRVGATSRGGAVRGPSQCCNVCTDEAFPMRDINAVNDISFVEVKHQVQQTQKKIKLSQTEAQKKGFVALANKLSMGAAAGGMGGMGGVGKVPATNVEQCCYLCSEQANGGWEGTDPFSEPTSWGQHLEDQSKDPDLMNEIKLLRTHHHVNTVSPYYMAGRAAAEGLSAIRL